MYASGSTSKKATIFNSRPPSPAASGKQGKHEAGRREDCCFITCMKMGSSVSQSQQATPRIEQQRQREENNNNNVRRVERPQSYPSPPAHHHIQLAALIYEAKSSGWYVEPHEIEFQERVAEGSTAIVYKGRWRGLDVAVKCISPQYFYSNEGAVLFFIQELETLSRQRHAFVLQLIGACLNPPEFGWLVTEFLSTTLKEWLHGSGERGEERRVPLPPFSERLEKALEIAEAMQYLHDQKPMVIHRDLKPSNIFLDDAKRVRVADFGNARFLCDGQKAFSGETGTYVYMAPEVILSRPYDHKCDVYSFGIILNELTTGQYPYAETNYTPFQIASAVIGEDRLRPALPGDEGQAMKELVYLICLLWDDNPSIRPTFAEITATLRKIKNKAVELIPI